MSVPSERPVSQTLASAFAGSPVSTSTPPATLRSTPLPGESRESFERATRGGEHGERSTLEGEQREGEHDAGEPYGGQPYEGEQHGGAYREGELHGGQPYEGQHHEAQPYGGQSYEGQPYGGQPYEGQPYSGQPYEGQPYSGQPYEGQPYGGQPYGGEHHAGEQHGGAYGEGEYHGGQSYEGQPHGGQPYGGQAYEGQPYGGEFHGGQPSEGGVAFGPNVDAGEPFDPPGSTSLPGGEDDPFLGTTIDGRYVLESVLGIGGMGVVYAGRHVLINKRVAIKVLRGDMTRDQDTLDRFRREAQAASSIGHAHIIDVSDYGQLPDGSAYLVMEFLEGRSLAQEMRALARLPAGRIVHIARQVADALGAAHAAGIIHRDLKPDNVHLITRGSDEDFVKILDFGIAKMAGPGVDRLTRAGMIFGTPHYMAPEQAAGTAVDQRTDVYSLGVMLYEMVSGTPPFNAENYMSILTQHMYKVPASLRTLDSAPPPGLEAIILKALAKRPDQRYQSMGEFVEDIDRYRSGEVPVAVRELLGNKGSLAVPLDYFQGVAPGVAGPPAAETRTGWGRYYTAVGVLSVVMAGVIPYAVYRALHPRQGDLNGHAAPPTPPDPPAPPTAAAPSAPAVASAPAPAAAPTGSKVHITTVPSNADIYIDGQKQGVSPHMTHVPLDQKIVVEARHEGFRSKSVTVDGKKGNVEIKLTALPRGGRPASEGGRHLPKDDITPLEPAPKVDDVDDPYAADKRK
jgi:eukaryotic-like serine/threonine-protein kinase